MNKKYIFGLLVIVVIGGGYAGYECLINDNNDGTEPVDSSSVSIDDTVVDTEIVDGISICSFNIQFLGHFMKKDDEALADLVKNFDIVVIQELVTPPYDGTYPDGTDYTSDSDSKEFFDAMTELGFKYVLSAEDTGPVEEIHKKTSATEWLIAFYDDDKVDYASDLPNGFLADDRSNHPDYER